MSTIKQGRLGMKSKMSFVRGKLGLMGAMAVASVVGGLTSAAVLAAIPDSNGKINTCYNNLTKTLRVTDPAGNCGANATTLSWDQQGGAKIYENRLQVATGTSGQQILSVPGFGDFTVTVCDDTHTHVGYKFKNTSSTLVDLGLNITNGGQSEPVAPGAESMIDPGTDSGYGNIPIILGQGAGSTIKTASLQIYAINDFDGVHTGCRFDAQAVVKQ
jgi:hypothetical protein